MERRRNRRPPGAAAAFSYRGGVRIAGTVLACDASTGRDLTFISSAAVAPQARLGGGDRGRRQLLLTETTLALLGRTGERVRRAALCAGYGRPFLLGEVRIELFPSGHLPGAASLLAEVEGRRIVYAGSLGVAGFEARTAQALWMDATFGHGRFAFPERAEALAAARRFTEEALAAGRQPVLLAAPRGDALDLAAALAEAGIPSRAGRAVLAAASDFRRAGLPVAPLLRFAGRLRAGEALLWPPDSRDAAIVRALPSAAFALVSGWAADSDIARRLRVEAAIPLSDRADRARLLAYAAATGATEIALAGSGAADLVGVLSGDGRRAYVLGPPRQLDLLPPGAVLRTEPCPPHLG